MLLFYTPMLYLLYVYFIYIISLSFKYMYLYQFIYIHSCIYRVNNKSTSIIKILVSIHYQKKNNEFKYP